MNGGGTQKTKSEPWSGVADQLHNAAVAADHGYNAARSAGFPGIDPATQQGWGALTSQATDPNSLLNNSLGLANQTVQGNFLSAGNPYFQQMYSKATQPMVDQFNQQIAPGIDATFLQAGRAGSGLYANARNSAEKTLAGALSDTAGSLAYQNYSDERARQNAAMTSAPGLATLPGGILGQVGQERQGQQLSANQYLLDLAGKYNSALSGMQGIGGTTRTSGGGQSPWLQALGLGLQGASMFL
ncbi:hypothetical protein [Inquilinus limosus]|uniref:Uncharacterized protein n=1 Tax=Inquilinus limosus TaxID=171674 RepID=A0A211ZQC8_9PROT|nr:hypothetical protein [Inquilinus limosus]OWJ67449.1 hypothetical protein BWR60_09595 [Inquilinus limosus]